MSLHHAVWLTCLNFVGFLIEGYFCFHFAWTFSYYSQISVSVALCGETGFVVVIVSERIVSWVVAVAHTHHQCHSSRALILSSLDFFIPTLCSNHPTPSSNHPTPASNHWPPHPRTRQIHSSPLLFSSHPQVPPHPVHPCLNHLSCPASFLCLHALQWYFFRLRIEFISGYIQLLPWFSFILFHLLQTLLTWYFSSPLELLLITASSIILCSNNGRRNSYMHTVEFHTICSSWRVCSGVVVGFFVLVFLPVFACFVHRKSLNAMSLLEISVFVRQINQTVLSILWSICFLSDYLPGQW